ncbi:hypothetical protein SAMN05421856_102250 [Chryseobacterium taichungense]|uniref:PglD N-terminal domain-containing protein n=1 Tax=Chryseobacterium taichungense TaxID=295069 RepID=A0A1H7X7A4_9FLAO|nr:hypothetical protein [Chryseobacterium taichungense]SEM29545.1 hypothetical protein SAMN05421856_102250 [Chryseobacterium taichungense]
MYLYGAVGHGKVVAEIGEESGYNTEACIDTNYLKMTTELYSTSQSAKT